MPPTPNPSPVPKPRETRAMSRTTRLRSKSTSPERAREPPPGIRTNPNVTRRVHSLPRQSEVTDEVDNSTFLSNFSELAVLAINTNIQLIKVKLHKFEEKYRRPEQMSDDLITDYNEIRVAIGDIMHSVEQQDLGEHCGPAVDYLSQELGSICNRIDSIIMEQDGVSWFTGRIPLPRLRDNEILEDDVTLPNAELSPDLNTGIPFSQEVEELVIPLVTLNSRPRPPTPPPPPPNQ